MSVCVFVCAWGPLGVGVWVCVCVSLCVLSDCQWVGVRTPEDVRVCVCGSLGVGVWSVCVCVCHCVLSHCQWWVCGCVTMCVCEGRVTRCVVTLSVGGCVDA